MAAELQRLIRGLGVGADISDKIWALVSGAIDGACASSKTGTWGSLLWLVKSLGVPIADLFGFKLPKGLVTHSTGNLAMILTIWLLGGMS